MTWFKSHWRWGMLNLFAVFTLIFVLTRGSADWRRTDTFDSGLESGKWAIRFLLTCLSMTPMNTYFGWSSAIKLRKSAGLWAFAFASLHVLLYIRGAKLDWLRLPMQSYLALGLTGLAILTALAITSNRWSMQRLGKNWKRVHRLVYLAGMAVVTHSLLAMTMSKKLHFRDPQAEYELKAYAAVLFALLVVRIPLVRQILRQIPVLWMRRRKSIQVLSGHDNDGELWPRIHGRESGASVKPTFIIPNETSNPPNPVRSGAFGRINDVSDGGLNSSSAEILSEAERETQEIA
ncbi:MAG TPA: ferric reductase-like transmembrane domain-containing protein [Anaerolineales bacterium]|nr:ferric reductase-like transmembrane domain-containing protein [Anaerolineales bacterium]